MAVSKTKRNQSPRGNNCSKMSCIEEEETEIVYNYEMVLQGEHKTVNYFDTQIGSFGAGGGCTIVAIVSNDGRCLLAHIDAMFRDVTLPRDVDDILEMDSEIYMTVHYNQYTRDKFKEILPPRIKIDEKDATSLMIDYNGNVHFNVPPPEMKDEDIHGIDQLAKELTEESKRVGDVYQKKLDMGYVRPPAPGLNYSFDSYEWRWIPIS